MGLGNVPVVEFPGLPHTGRTVELALAVGLDGSEQELSMEHDDPLPGLPDCVHLHLDSMPEKPARNCHVSSWTTGSGRIGSSAAMRLPCQTRRAIWRRGRQSANLPESRRRCSDP